MEAERIQNDQRFYVLEYLRQSRTLVRMHAPGKQYECLTLVTDVGNSPGAPFFLVDCPRGFKEAVGEEEGCRFHFEFTDENGLKYNFRTSGHRIFKDEVSISVPEFIERIQRRKNFRIQPPAGAKLLVDGINSARHVMSIVNISRSGTLGALVLEDDDKTGTSDIRTGCRLKNLEMVFPLAEKESIICVQEAEIKRIEKKPGENRNLCAFHFTDIGKKQEKVLVDLIFRIQRDLLRKRS